MTDPFDRTVSAEIAEFKAEVLRLIEGRYGANCNCYQCQAFRDLRAEVEKL